MFNLFEKIYAIIKVNNFLVMLEVFVLYDNYFAGITVAYSAPTRHGCLKVVENNYCASRRGMISSMSMIIPLVLFLHSEIMASLFI